MALRNVDDLFELLPASASIRGPLSIGCPKGSFRPTFKIYERALVIACPILLPFAHYCGISVQTNRDVPITCKPQVADPELRLATIISVGTSFFTRANWFESADLQIFGGSPKFRGVRMNWSRRSSRRILF
jgi:hypothetical protein